VQRSSSLHVTHPLETSALPDRSLPFFGVAAEGIGISCTLHLRSHLKNYLCASEACDNICLCDCEPASFGSKLPAAIVGSVMLRRLNSGELLVGVSVVLGLVELIQH
jgi:hypothetical protein